MAGTIRPITVAGALVATAALVIAVIALVNAGEDGKNRTIELVTVSSPEAEASADLGPKGGSATDLVTFSEEARRDGEPAGRTFGTCTLTGSPQESRLLCSLTAELDEGKITAAGTVDHRRDDQPQELPIVGGTGAFRNATGTMTLGQRAGDETPLTFSVSTNDE